MLNSAATDHPAQADNQVMEARRQHPRIDGGTSVEVFWDDRLLTATLQNISVGGVSIRLQDCGEAEDFLLVLEPDIEQPVALYLRCVERTRTDNALIARA
jgi:hypothetical protein